MSDINQKNIILDKLRTIEMLIETYHDEILNLVRVDKLFHDFISNSLDLLKFFGANLDDLNDVILNVLVNNLDIIINDLNDAISRKVIHRDIYSFIGKLLLGNIFSLLDFSQINKQEFKNKFVKFNIILQRTIAIETDEKNKERFDLIVENLKSSNFLNIETRFKGIENKIEELENNKNNLINDLSKNYEIKFVQEMEMYKNQVKNLSDNFENSIGIKRKDIDEAVKVITEQLTQTFGDLKNYKSIINNKTETEVSKHYAKKANQEKITYWVSTIFSLIIIGISIGLALAGLHEYYASYVDPQGLTRTLKGLTPDKIELTQHNAFLYLILRLILSVLLFLTVIYTSRIAYRAYVHWRHSENMQLKLSSLRPFINLMEKEERIQIHKDLVPDYFGKDAGMVDGVSEKFKDIPTNVSAIAMKAIEQVGGGKSDKEEKDSKESKGEK